MPDNPVFADGVSTTTTGSTNEVVVKSRTIPGNLLAARRALVVEVYYSDNTSAATPASSNVSLQYGGAKIRLNGVTLTHGVPCFARVLIIQKDAGNITMIAYSIETSEATFSHVLANGVVDTTSPQNLDLRVVMTGPTNSFVFYGWFARILVIDLTQVGGAITAASQTI